MLSLIAATALLVAQADHHGHQGHDHHAETPASSTVSADVRAVDAENRTALVRHDALTEMGMGAMTMRFAVADGVDFSLFQVGAALKVTVARGPDGLEIIAAEPRSD